MTSPEEDAKSISVSEAMFLMKNVKEKYTNPRLKSHEIFNGTWEYVERYGKITDQNAIDMLKTFLRGVGFTDQENASFISLLPSNITDAKILIPSITHLDDSMIDSAIMKIRELTSF